MDAVELSAYARVVLVVRVALFGFVALSLAGCGGDDAPAQKSCHTSLRASDVGLSASDGCSTTLSLLPRVRMDGTWHSASGCVPAAAGVDCAVGPVGSVHLEVDATRVSLRFDAAAGGALQAISLDGSARVPGARGFLSNGFQSWSQSGVVALAPAPSESDLEAALALRGDGEVTREGSELSNAFTFVGGSGSGLVLGALAEQRFRVWMSVHREHDGDDLTVRVGEGNTGESIAVAAGDVVEGEPLHVELGPLEASLEHYAAALPSRRQTTPRDAQIGWNSWYELWDTVDAGAMDENAALASGILGSYADGRKLRIVVDDGWQQAWGDWQPNDKFPNGLSGLATTLHAQGYEVGVWLAPLLVAESSAVAQAHPDWLVGGASYNHPKHGAMRVLDVTQPQAAAHLAQVISSIVGWGYDLLKIDFLFAGTWEATSLRRLASFPVDALRCPQPTKDDPVVGEAMLGRMSLVFYGEIGFSAEQIALYSKFFGGIVTAVFSLMGAVINTRFGVVKGLFVGGVAMASSNLLFALMAVTGPDVNLLLLTMLVDNFSAAFATVAFISFISYFTSRTYTGTQYALMSSVSNFGRTTLAASSGVVVDSLGGDWALFFILTALMVIPGLLLLLWIGKQIQQYRDLREQPAQTDEPEGSALRP